MIARVKFEGTVRNGKKKSVLPDHVDIHVQKDNGLEMATTIFNNWLSTAKGIRGASGVFHPIGNGGEIKITEVVEAVE